MAKEMKTFPTIPVSHWLNLRNQFKKSIPGTVTTNYVASILGMTENSARTNILPTLRMIKLINENGSTNQELAKKFRDDQQYKSFCEGVLKANYPQEVRDAFPDKSSDRERVKSWFMNHSGVGASGAQRIVAFYFTLLEADPNATISGSSKTTTAKPKSSKKEAPAKVATPKVETPKAPPAVPQGNGLPDLNLNIQIHISSDATPDQIEKIFEAMSKHLYRNK